MTRATLVVMLVSVAARAEVLPAAEIEQQWVDPAGRGTIFVGNGLGLKALQFRAGVAAMYTRGNLRVGSTALIDDRFTMQVFGALGITSWLELGAVAPVIVAQGSPVPDSGLAAGGLGNPWIHARVSILDELAPLLLGVSLGIGVPVGTAVALGNSGVGVAPRVQLGKLYDEWSWGVDLGFLYRPEVDYSTVSGRPLDSVGSQVFLGFAAATASVKGPRGELSFRLHVPLTGNNVGGELQVGARWPVGGGVELFASAGPGFFGEPQTPLVRVVAGMAFATAPLTQPRCVEGRPYTLQDCPLLDRDGDGVPNGVDRAPEVAEDRDGFEDEDGAPDPDNDADAVRDGEDRCPVVPGPGVNGGCPDEDGDHDGVVDRLDRCPQGPEDINGVEDEDGCPETPVP